MPSFTDKRRGEIYASYAKMPSHLNMDLIHDNEEQYNVRKIKNYLNDLKNTSSANTTHYTSYFSADGVPLAQPINSDEPPVMGVPYNEPPRVIHHHHSSNDNVWFWMWLMNRNNQPAQNVYVNTAPSNTNTNNNSSSRQQNQSSFKDWAIIGLLVAVTIGPAIASGLYLTGEVVNNLQRLYYNEGYLQAGLGFASIVSSLGLGIYIVDALFANTISAMCVSAGFSNPIGWTFLALSLMTLITAAVLNLLIQNSLYSLSATCHANTALYPEEPQRFSLSDEQAARLPKGVDPEKVCTAITAIQYDMPKPGVLRYNPFSLWFFDTNTSKKLQQIRSLRMNGTVDYTTTIGTKENNDEVELHFTSASLRK